MFPAVFIPQIEYPEGIIDGRGKKKGVEPGYSDIIRLFTGVNARIFNWFDFRFIVGENAFGEEQLGEDVWLISVPGVEASSDTSNTVVDLLTFEGNAKDRSLTRNHADVHGAPYVVVKDGQVIGSVSLPIAGLMSNKHADEVAEEAASVLAGFQACGCDIINPNMQLSLLALVVIPELRISDLGLVDVTKFEFVPVLEGERS